MKLLVGLYPRAWRQRYGAELAALLEDDPPGPRALLDLLKGALEQHMTRGKSMWIVGMSGLLGVVAAVALYFVVPKTYTSGATIGVIPMEPQVSNAQVTDRINWVAEIVLTRTQLVNIINNFGLYQGERQRNPIEDVIDQMRHDIHIIPGNVLGGAARPGGFRIEFSHPDRVMAQRVTQDLITRFIDGNTRVGSGAPVNFELYDPASIPINPVSPVPSRMALWGLAGGAGLGALVVWLRRGGQPKLVADGVLEVASGGALVFGGTAVPVGEMLDYLKSDRTLSQFLEDFPTVKRDAAIATLSSLRGNA